VKIANTAYPLRRFADAARRTRLPLADRVTSMTMTEPSVTPKPKLHWYQFSLRTLLLSVTVCALGCSWLALPTARAHRFVSAVRNGDIERADSMFGRSNTVFPGTVTQARLSELEVAPLTFGQLWRGERFVGGYVPYDPSEKYALDCHVGFRVTRWGITIDFFSHG
jgi:hypothetical protein